MKASTRALIVFILFGGAGVAMADPTLTLGLRLQDTNDQDLPDDNGHYEMAPGEQFRVVVTASIGNANWTDAYHTDSTHQPIAPIQLGIQSLSANLVSSGTPGMLSPLAGPIALINQSTPVHTWNLTDTDPAETLALPSDLGLPWVNLLDLNNDGDLDVAGLGFGNTSAIQSGWGANTSASYLAGLQNGLGSQTDIMRGGYVVNSHGTSTLTLSSIEANYLFDPSVQNNVLGAKAFSPGNITVESIAITAPEPGSLMVIAATGLLMLAARRRPVGSAERVA